MAPFLSGAEAVSGTNRQLWDPSLPRSDIGILKMPIIIIIICCSSSSISVRASFQTHLTGSRAANRANSQTIRTTVGVTISTNVTHSIVQHAVTISAFHEMSIFICTSTCPHCSRAAIMVISLHMLPAHGSTAYTAWLCDASAVGQSPRPAVG
jgi:hypothetical protein